MKIHIIIEYRNREQGGEEVTLLILGKYSDLQRFAKMPTLSSNPQMRLVKSFLCGPSVLSFPCGNKCTDHNKFRDITNELLFGVEFTHEFQFRSGLVPMDAQDAAITPATPATDADLPRPEFIMTSSPPSPVRRHDPTFSTAQAEELLNVIAAKVEITIAAKFLLVRLNDQAEFTADAHSYFEAIAKFIRHQLRNCGYQFEAMRVVGYDETERYLFGKCIITKVGDFEQTKRLDPRIADKVRRATLERHDAETLRPVL